MKYAIMSDVHANPLALEKQPSAARQPKAALADARGLGCEKFLLLGDITGYGYDAKGAIKIVRENFDVVLLGNHDSACLGRENSRYDRINPSYDQDRRQHDLLSATDLKWLGGRRYLRVVDGMALAHGDFTKPEEWNYVYEPVEAAVSLAARKENLLFCGHSHHADAWELTKDKNFKGLMQGRIKHPATAPESIVFERTPGSRYIVNVGSVGYPRNDLCSTYVICDPTADTFTLRRLPFDFKSYLMEMLAHKIDLPGWLCQLLVAAQKE